MLYLILSILSSVSVGVLLKISSKNNANIYKMISLNYLVALILTYNLFDVSLNNIPSNLPWDTLIGLAILLPTIFFAFYDSINKVGIIKTDIAQRLSLFIPIVAAIFIFKENITTIKYIGLAFGLFAIYFTLSKTDSKVKSKKYIWVSPLLVFVGVGVIDVLFKQIALYSEVPYTTSLFYIFSLALLVSLLINLFLIVSKKGIWNIQTLYFGLALGILNFSNVYFYLKSHMVFSENPTTVFACMNFGVILLGTIIGVVVFKEKLSKKNIFGLFLAVIAITLIALSQYYKI